MRAPLNLFFIGPNISRPSTFLCNVSYFHYSLGIQINISIHSTILLLTHCDTMNCRYRNCFIEKAFSNGTLSLIAFNMNEDNYSPFLDVV